MRMDPVRVKWLAAVLVSGHLSLLAAYTMPAEWVPVRLRFWSQAYARVMFHQDWRLFAPDPPPCACTLEVKSGAIAEWVPVSSFGTNPVWRRMIANTCRYTEASSSTEKGRVAIGEALSRSLGMIAAEVGVEAPARFRLRRDFPGSTDGAVPARTEVEELTLIERVDR